jgi:hypothetical protein
MAHDAATFGATGDEHSGAGPKGTTPRFKPVAPLVAAALLTGLRFEHLLALRWESIDFEQGTITPDGGSATKRIGVIDLGISPGLSAMLANLRPGERAGGRVFGMTSGEARAAMRRLLGEFDAPPGSGWQALRRTCGCFLTNAPGIFGGDPLVASAKYEGKIEWRPTFALWWLANYPPRIEDDDEGMWSRARVVPFDKPVPKERQDKTLKEKLSGPEHAPAVLAWLVQGYLAWDRDGLGTCQAVEPCDEELSGQPEPSGGLLGRTLGGDHGSPRWGVSAGHEACLRHLVRSQRGQSSSYHKGLGQAASGSWHHGRR